MYNYLLDTGVDTIVIVKVVYEEISLNYTRDTPSVLELYGSPIITIGEIKYVSISLHKWSQLSFPQEIVVVYLPPLFGLCLSIEFMEKIGG